MSTKHLVRCGIVVVLLVAGTDIAQTTPPGSPTSLLDRWV